MVQTGPRESFFYVLWFVSIVVFVICLSLFLLGQLHTTGVYTLDHQQVDFFHSLDFFRLFWSCRYWWFGEYCRFRRFLQFLQFLSILSISSIWRYWKLNISLSTFQLLVWKNAVPVMDWINKNIGADLAGKKNDLGFWIGSRQSLGGRFRHFVELGKRGGSWAVKKLTVFSRS